MLRQSALLGFGPAQSRVALSYLNGEGVDADATEAAAWAMLAREQDARVPGAEVLDRLENLQGQAAQLRAAKLGQEIDAAKLAALHAGDTSLLSAAEINTPLSAASGFFVNGEGLLVTSYRPVAEASELRVIIGATSSPARLVAVDEEADVAVLQCNTPSPAWLSPSSEEIVIGKLFHLAGYHKALESPGELAWLTAPVVLGPEPPERRNLFAVGRFWPASMAGGAFVDSNGRYAGVLTSRADFQQRMEGAESSPFSTEPGFVAHSGAINTIISYTGHSPAPPPSGEQPPSDETALTAMVARAVVTVLIY